MTYKSQGDVNFRSTKKLNIKGAKPITDGIIARGEVTGHSHSLSTLEGVELYQFENGAMGLIVGENGVSIQHQEHAPVTLPPGQYEVTIDREYSDEGERRVKD